MPLLELKNISHAYGNHAVVSDLSLSLQQGTIGCLLGPSGCGKTTVLRAIAGFEPIHSGEIHLNGSVVGSLVSNVPPEQRRIGMVFQDYALFPHLNVTDNIAFGLRNATESERRTRVEELLVTVGLSGAGGKYQMKTGFPQREMVI